VEPPRAPRVRVPLPGLLEGEQRLAAKVGRYLASVHRLRPGDRFAAFDPARAVEAEGVVVDVTAEGLVALMGPLRPARLVASRELVWVQGLPKADKMDGIIRDATELGATRIVPATTTYTVVKLDGSRQGTRLERWQRIAAEAARQCGRGDPPEVLPALPWPAALSAARASGGAAFCLYERATDPLGVTLSVALEADGPVTFAAGPEGGLAENEVLAATEAGFTVASLGPFVLRAETVAAAVLGAVRVLEGMRHARQADER